MKSDKERFFELIENCPTLRFVRQGGKRFLCRNVAWEPEMSSVIEIKRYGDHIEYLESMAE